MSLVGYAFLRESLDLPVFEIAKPAMVKPVTRITDFGHLIGVPAAVAPADEGLLNHLMFALKHEGINLQLLAAAMEHVTADELRDTFAKAPAGQYVRMLCSIWEHFRGQPLLEAPKVVAPYVDLFDPKRYFVGPVERDPRWRVNFNGLGTWKYCVTVERRKRIVDLQAMDILGRVRDFLGELNQETLARTLNWAYLSETIDSYAIEQEAPSEDRARTFVRLLHQAHEPRTITEDYLVELQASIIQNPYLQAVQFRNEQNYLRNGNKGALGVTFVPPEPELAAELMTEFMEFANGAAKQGVDPIFAASIASFGFVYLHPFMDGNGRLSRFLFHKLLCASGQLAQGTLLPVSVAMKKHEAEYLRVLTSFSRPARELVNVKSIGDGRYDCTFKSDDKIYRYWDATEQVQFGLEMAQAALDLELRREVEFIAHFDAVYREVNEQFDVQQSTLATLVSIALGAEGRISKTKRDRYRAEVPEAAFSLIERLAREALGLPDPDAPDTADGPYRP